MNKKYLLLLWPFLLVASIYLYKRLQMPTSPPPISYKKETPLKWGVYAGDNVNDFINMQQTVGKQADYLPVFVHWGSNKEFPSQLAEYAYLQNQTLVIYWEAMDPSSDHPESDIRYSYDRILAGKYDTYIKSFAASVKEYGRPVIIIPFEEMNGNWYPWSVTTNNNSPQKHVAAYRYIKKYFSNMENVQLAWVVNSNSVPDTEINQPMSYYPGDNYVDIIGIDGFNFGDPWQTFTEVFSQSFADVQKMNKPVIITSMASAPGDNKSDWIKQASFKILENNQIVGWIWFNENKEKDWRIWSDPDSLSAFKSYLLTAK